MGVQNLKVLLKRYGIKGICDTRELIHYAGKVIAIDISIYLYKFKSMKQDEFIDLFVQQIHKLLKANIIPFYVFDGEAPNEKKEELENRVKHKNDLIEKQEKLEKALADAIENKQDVQEIQNAINKTNRSIITIRHCDKIACIRLFDLLGIPYIVAEGEAEALCARLTRAKIAYGVLSEDTDLLPNHCENFIVGTGLSNKVCEYNLRTILEEMQMTYEQFVDLCILCGCDYIKRELKGIGPVTAYKLIKQYKTIEAIILSPDLTKKTIPEGYLGRVANARRLFMTYDEKAILHMSGIEVPICLSVPNIDDAKNFLKDETTIDEKIINSLIKMLKKITKKKVKINNSGVPVPIQSGNIVNEVVEIVKEKESPKQVKLKQTNILNYFIM